MQLTLRDNLPFITVSLAYQGALVTIPSVLVDTGSARTIFSADVVSKLHITPAPDDVLYIIRGVGGTEVVFSRKIDSIQIGERSLSLFEIQIGGMNYGFEIQGILGMDFLQKSKAIVNLATLEMAFV